MIRHIIIAIAATMVCNMGFAKNKIFFSQPSISTLTGTIKVKVSPGPPNYESIKKGDTAEPGYYLTLDKPIDVNLLPKVRIPENSLDEPEKNVKKIQLVISRKHDWSIIKSKHHVKLTGKLFHWFTGHHHTKVLMDVKKAKQLS